MRRMLVLVAVAAAFAAPQAQAVNVVKCVLDNNNVDPEYGGNNYLDPEGTVACIRGTG